MSDAPHVAVTGAAGFIGSRVLGQLRRDHPDWELTALDNFYRGEVREVEGVPVEHVDIRHRDQLAGALAGADVVVHLAALSGVESCDSHPDLAYETNVVGTTNVAYTCKREDIALVFPFSAAVLGDPTEFPITTAMERDPLNWYGETKVLGEQAIETLADGSFPAHQFLVANLYGQHTVGDRTISKDVVIDFFVERALAGEPLTVYEPGTQARNFVHVNDVANAFCLSVEQLLDAHDRGETGSTAFELATDEAPSVMTIAELVAEIAREERGLDPEIRLVENPRAAETLVDEFTVDTTAVHKTLGWEPHHTVETTIRELLSGE
ncbi:NAD-dependent epimerase/dehydratase family protein [Halosegnis longus]|uniref:NAD(P)-dependent oxidoreductase n=1 Tax=Halosegnis longus TaxID=2216012 RepID=A0AAJ4UWQ0_9EURY|nr:NAD(P)-dependent oxidoreductase [Salella cibi]